MSKMSLSCAVLLNTYVKTGAPAPRRLPNESRYEKSPATKGPGSIFAENGTNLTA